MINNKKKISKDIEEEFDTGFDKCYSFNEDSKILDLYVSESEQLGKLWIGTLQYDFEEYENEKVKNSTETIRIDNCSLYSSHAFNSILLAFDYFPNLKILDLSHNLFDVGILDSLKKFFNEKKINDFYLILNDNPIAFCKNPFEVLEEKEWKHIIIVSKHNIHLKYWKKKNGNI